MAEAAKRTNEQTQQEPSSVEGFVIDIACVRKIPREELVRKASRHSRDCALMGHCVESGYALVGDDGTVTLLDNEATPLVLDAVRRSTQQSGIRLRAERENQEGEMQTTRVERIGNQGE